MLIKLAGVAQDQKVYLVRSRKPEGEMLSGEFEHRSREGKLIEFRKKLPTNENGSNKPIANATLNKIQHNTFDNDNGKSTPFSLIFTGENGKTHILNMGSGMLAQNVVNSLGGCLSMSKEELATAKFEFSFWFDKTSGYNKSSVKVNGERTEWRITPEEQATLIKKFPDPRNPSKPLVDKTEYVEALKAIADELNTMLPPASSANGNVLDDLDDEEYDRVTRGTVDEVLDADEEVAL